MPYHAGWQCLHYRKLHRSTPIALVETLNDHPHTCTQCGHPMQPLLGFTQRELFVVCPAIVADKARPGFTAPWAQAAFQQQTLLEVRRLDAHPTKGATP